VILALNISAFADSSFDQGVALYNARDYRGALKRFAETQPASPNETTLYYMAMCYTQIGDNLHAHNCYQQIITSWPNSQAAQLARQGLAMLDRAGSRSSATGTGSNQAMDMQSMLSPSEREAKERETELRRLPNVIKVPFTRATNGLLTVQGSVNGRRQTLVFDTGAAACVFPRNMLESSGVVIDRNAPAVRGGGVGGAMSGVMVPLDLSIGELSRKMVVVAADKMPFALIGPSFFEGFAYNVDNGGGFIQFVKKSMPGMSSRDDQSTDVVKVPFVMMANHIIVQAIVNGHPMPMVFDTGASVCTFPAMFAGLVPKTEDSGLTRLQGVGGFEIGYNTYVDRIQLGPITSTHVKAVVGAGSEPLLGETFFGGKRFTIDTEHQTINFAH
jgi:predicted aspartyl protease